MFAVTVPVVMATISTNVETIIAWRFIQGLLLPPIFTVVLAYIGDEWPPAGLNPLGEAGRYRGDVRSIPEAAAGTGADRRNARPGVRTTGWIPSREDHPPCC